METISSFAKKRIQQSGPLSTALHTIERVEFTKMEVLCATYWRPKGAEYARAC